MPKDVFDSLGLSPEALNAIREDQGREPMDAFETLQAEDVFEAVRGERPGSVDQGQLFLDQLSEFGREEGGQMAGGFTGGIQGAALGAKVPGGPRTKAVGTLIGGAIGAGAGGFLGDLTQKTGQELLNEKELSFQGFKKNLLGALQAGGEEAVMDLAAGAVFRGGSLMMDVLRAKPAEGAQLAQKLLESQNATLALDQATDTAYKTFGELMRGSMTGSPLVIAQKQNQEMAIKFADELVERFSGGRLADLQPDVLAHMIQENFTNIEKVHAQVAGSAFTQVDNLVPNITVPGKVTKDIPAITGVRGANTVEVAGPGVRVIPAVDVAPLKVSSDKLITDLAKINNIGALEEGKRVLEQLSGLPERLTFKESHELRSNLLALKRALPDDPTVKSSNYGNFIHLIDKQMDQAGRELSPQGLATYRQITAFWKRGRETFRNKMYLQFMKQTPQQAGENLFRGNSVQLIKDFKEALFIGRESGLSKAENEKIWRTVQSGYLRNMMPQTLEELPNAPIFKLDKISGRQIRATYNRMFTAEQKKTISENAKALEVMSSAGKRGNLNLRQLDSINRLWQAAAGAGAVGGGLHQDSNVAVTLGVGFLLAPAILSRAMLNKGLVKSLARLGKFEPGTKNFSVAATKLAGDAGKFYGELQKEGFDLSQAIREFRDQEASTLPEEF